MFIYYDILTAITHFKTPYNNLVNVCTGCLPKKDTLQSIIFSSILEIQQNQIYHWIRNYYYVDFHTALAMCG